MHTTRLHTHTHTHAHTRIMATVACLVAAHVLGHGHITIPHARNNATVANAGNCEGMQCMWFSQIVEIPGEPTLPDYARSFNVKVNSGPDDWSAKLPWRAPGTAPVLGSGCGVAGGGPIPRDNGGIAPPGYVNGDDFLKIPVPPRDEWAVWKRGTSVEVAWATFANHGGGYSWRLCKKGGNVSEECFQQNTLDFDGNTSWIRYPPIAQWGEWRTLPDVEIPAVRVTEGTYPKGSMWTRNPIPGCFMCDQAECMRNHSVWIEQQHCSQSCSGLNVTGRTCPPGMTQFPEPASGLSGYYAQTCVPGDDGQSYCDGLSGFNYNIVDKVIVPTSLPAGDYLLSWRWDCEQSRQIWQNCADITLV
eukprot:m.160015 g.160015  ORF g.160015 m.160015 type:complete len:360 (+) comp11890_c0_seq1:499-1578(+)